LSSTGSTVTKPFASVMCTLCPHNGIPTLDFRRRHLTAPLSDKFNTRGRSCRHGASHWASSSWMRRKPLRESGC
jgi:hypothetical protein